MRTRARHVLLAVTAAAAYLAGGCIGVSDVFNEEFLQATAFGPDVATLPGDAPAVLVGVENRTSRVVQAQVSYRGENSQVVTYLTLVEAGEKTAQSINCPLSEVTLGDVSNLEQIGAIVRLGDGNAADPFVEVEAFGVLLKDEANYDCGDSITFAIVPSSETLSGYRVFAYIQRAGQE